jgi:hypothetical protein
LNLARASLQSSALLSEGCLVASDQVDHAGRESNGRRWHLRLLPGFLTLRPALLRLMVEQRAVSLIDLAYQYQGHRQWTCAWQYARVILIFVINGSIVLLSQLRRRRCGVKPLEAGRDGRGKIQEGEYNLPQVLRLISSYW